MKSSPVPAHYPTVEALPPRQARGFGVLSVVALCLAGAACWASMRDTATATPTPLAALPAQPVDAPLAAVPAQLVDPLPPVATAQPRLEIAFALDTTGSMGGLLETAKKKVWGIVNTLAAAEPRPQISLGLVAYRDAGDAYVTQSYPLTSDLDTFYQALYALQPDGGGDSPEAVREALSAAAGDMHWTADATRVVFLVGDAPPHAETLQACVSSQVWKDAQGASIAPAAINTILCGEDSAGLTAFQAIAAAHTGEFVAIESTPQAQAVASPFDAEILRLQGEVEATLLVYGSRADKARTAAQQAGNYGNTDEMQCQRASALSKTGGFYNNDLIWASENDAVVLEDLKDDELPDQLKGLKPSARKAELEALSRTRSAASKRLSRVVAQRDAWIATQPELLGSFELRIRELLAAQLAKHGFSFGC